MNETIPAINRLGAARRGAAWRDVSTKERSTRRRAIPLSIPIPRYFALSPKRDREFSWKKIRELREAISILSLGIFFFRERPSISSLGNFYERVARLLSI